MPSKLLVHPSKSADGVEHRITPESAGWIYVGFESRSIARGGVASWNTGEREVCVVVLSGKARVTTGEFDSGPIGERADVFAGLPWSVYAPPRRDVAIAAVGEDCEIA